MGCTHKLHSLRYPLNSESDDMPQELLKPFNYITAIPGKQIRQKLIKVLKHWMPIPEDKVPIVETITHYIHNSSLLIDDIDDDSELRRGLPVAHSIYGIPRTIYAVNYIHSRLYYLFDQLGDMKLTLQCFKTIEEIIAGQGMDIYWRDNFVCPTEAEYLQMIYRKTALLFIIPLNIINTFTTAKKVDSSKLLITLGLYFQINDDYQNLHNQKYFEDKGFCEDITEGKFSFPIVHAVNNFPKEGKEIMDILRERTQDVKLKERCLSLLEKCGSFEYTKKVLTDIKKVAFEEVSKLHENPLMGDFINKAMVACS